MPAMTRLDMSEAESLRQQATDLGIVLSVMPAGCEIR